MVVGWAGRADAWGPAAGGGTAGRATRRVPWAGDAARRGLLGEGGAAAAGMSGRTAREGVE